MGVPLPTVGSGFPLQSSPFGRRIFASIPNANTHMKDYIEQFTRAYKVAALWSSTDDDGNALDTGRDLDDISGDTHNAMDRDCTAFVEQNWEDLKDLDPQQCGHDFWLTRCGHGAGFWDRGLGEVGDRLSAACGHGTPFPNIDPYVGDDGMVHAY